MKKTTKKTTKEFNKKTKAKKKPSQKKPAPYTGGISWCSTMSRMHRSGNPRRESW